MIVRRCLALIILASSLCLVQCLIIADDGPANLRGMALTEPRLNEEGVVKNAEPPTETNARKTKTIGPETTKAKPKATSTKTTNATSTKTTKAPAPAVATTKAAAPTVATTETDKTKPPVDKKSAAQSDEMGQDDEPEEESEKEPEEEAGSKSPQDEEATPNPAEYEPKHESKLDDESQPDDESDFDGKSPNDKEQTNKQQPDEDKSKEDEPDGTETPTPNATSDLCANATSCLECEKAATNVTFDDKTCVWKDSACTVVAKEDAPSDTECDDHKETDHKVTTSVEDEEEEKGSFVPGFVVVVVVFGLLAFRKYFPNHDIIIPGVGGGIPGAFRQQRSSSLRNSRHTETVPLARSDDDEWGWDESGGDVELPISRKQQKEAEDLEMAMALSLSTAPPMTSKAGGRMAPYPTKRSNSGARTTPPSSGGDWDDWDDESPSSPRVAASTQPAAIPKIASLGVRQPVVTRPKVAEKPKEDDIFASMGLAAKPKFSHRPANAPASRASTAASPSLTTSTLSAAAAVVGEDVGEDWDNDSDLDDLLDE